MLVVGSGGREHALAWKLAQSPELDELHAAPGNPGIAEVGSCHPVLAEDAEGVLALARSLRIDLVVIGPDAPLVAGLADRLRRGGVPVFGPSAAAARIEGSKSFGKDVLERAGVPSARTLPVARVPCVVKADGLTRGKGVFVCRTDHELESALTSVRRHGAFHIEELLEGAELSVFAICDGRRAVPLAAARDYKRASDGDAGPNTGGMGAFSPVPDTPSLERLVAEIHRPVLAELAERGAPFSGVLYAGLMLTDDGPRVLEFNCRLGDPEAQVVLPMLDEDLSTLLWAATSSALPDRPARFRAEPHVGVVVASAGYPESSDTGRAIHGLDAAERVPGALVFHAGTARQDDRIVTAGGRVLTVVGRGRTYKDAIDVAYRAAAEIRFDGMQLRSDIGRKALAIS